ncbi:FAD-dependent oxidoreductase [Derxia lacustris]|uniref:FAD-dependent oxidoreductase n=1 Tax=Derxia lacustris TaxID=764842 RepID=UPI000A16CD8B|nr:FAD-dependent oxidoreductase [Derxia lacustris]
MAPATGAAPEAGRKRLLLLGGGHAHVGVLRDFARRPVAGWELTLLSPSARQIYSGMLPGWIAGRHALDDCAIDLAALAARAGARRVIGSASGLDPAARTVRLADGRQLGYDLLSLDIGSVSGAFALTGGGGQALALRPIEDFVERLAALVARIVVCGRPVALAVVGAGAAGVELVFALRARARRDGWPPLTLLLVGSQALPLPGMPDGLRRRAALRLARAGIDWIGNARVTAVLPDRLVCAGMASRPVDACICATGAVAAPWLAASGLATDAAGFVRVDAALQSLSHPGVFAAGDVAALAVPRPRSGVFAVRAGPALARNLRAACAGQPLQAWQPQRQALYLLGLDDGSALASWGALWSEGRWAARLKARIDRRFVRRANAAAGT